MEKTNITTEELKTLLVENNFDAAATAEAISKVMPLEVADIEKAIGDNLAWFTCDLDEGEPIELDEDEFNEIAKDINALFTYDVFFDDREKSTENKGFATTLEDAKSYVDTLAPYQYKGYEGGIAYVRCNETEEVVYEVDLPERALKLKSFDYIYKFIENEIEEGVCLVEGTKPTVAELLEFHLEANDDNFLSFIFYDDDCQIDSLHDLTEEELDQVNRLRKYCEE